MVKSVCAAVRQLLNSSIAFATTDAMGDARVSSVPDALTLTANFGQCINGQIWGAIATTTGPSYIAANSKWVSQRCATCCMPIKRRQHEFVFEFQLKLKTKWKLKFVQRADCLTLSRKFNWVVAAAARLSLSCRFSILPHWKLAGWRSSASASSQGCSQFN